MKQKRILIAALMLIGLLFAAYQFSVKAEAKETGNTSEITITGEVIDISCYLGNGKDGIGSEHKDCAVMCSKAGSALAILTSSGDVYFPVSPMGKNNNEKLLDFVGENVEATGMKLSQGNLLGIKISALKKAE